jgi:hypothetical protein
VIPRYLISLVLVTVALTVACIDMSAPSGPASISDLKLPSPSVIIGDTMRDSLGKVAPIQVIAYDVHSFPIATTTTELFITDSVPAAHIVPVGLLIGDRFGTVHVLGQVNQLQTMGVTIPVTYRPATLTAAAVDTLRVSATGDTSVKSPPFAVRASVRSAKDSASEKILVYYALVSAPASADPKNPAVYISDDAGKRSGVDTTDASGNVSRNLTVVTAFLGDTALLLGQKVDSAVITITSSYAGVPLDGSPRTVVVPIKVTFDIPAPSTAPLRRSTLGDILVPPRSQRGNRWARAVVPEIQPPAR